jgi:type II restriction/modification system DNA methylase subunit YeeA
MNTNTLKKFAQEARKKLIEQIGAKLEFVLTSDSAELREKATQVKKLQEEINATSKTQVIDKVAYTWFNRLMALRFMDANDYQPLGLRVVTPKDNYTLPEILDEAKQGNISDDLPVNQQQIYDVLDGKTPSNNAQNEAYKELLIGACNYLNIVFPFLFEKINNYSELLLPDDLISEFSIIQDIRDGMTTEDCQEVEIVGWLYQFYISEKKDEVFASKSKVKKEDIPAATQLFTPRWIVEYMVQNTVGKLWLQNNPNSKLREYMPYFIESPSVESEDYLKINSVEEITLLDQACGSGHILVYGFELLAKIYEEEGYNASEIPQLIIEKNLFGFEIDERAAQLAGLALLMKARSYHRRAFRKELKPNILCYKDVFFTKEALINVLELTSLDKSAELQNDIKLLENATNFGSLITPRTPTKLIEQGLADIKKQLLKADLFQQNLLDKLQLVLEQLFLLNKKYHCIVDNPPYMGGGNMNKVLGDFVKKNYTTSKADLMVCFMNRTKFQLLENGFVGMINLPSWMFLSSFEEYRKELINEYNIDTLLHLGRGVFGSDFGSVAFTLIFKKNNFFNGIYRRLFKEHVQVRSINKIKQLFLDKEYGYYESSQESFKKVPGNQIGYWLSERMLKVFEESNELENYASVRQGMATSNNNRFLKYWFEVSFSNIGVSVPNRKIAMDTQKKWFPYNKGGSYRKWFGNIDFVVNWENDGEEIKKFRDFKNSTLTSSMGVAGLPFIFKPNITWSKVTAGKFSVRYFNEGFLFDVSGCSIFEDNILTKILPLMNSKVITKLLGEISPTVNFEVGHIKAIPILTFDYNFEEITSNCIAISTEEWNSDEYSWNHKKNDFIRIKGQDIEETYDLYKEYWKNRFFQLHKNEEELNRKFIGIYEMQDEINPDVFLKDITILKEETKIVNNQLVFQEKEVFKQFMSYAVGCMFGRYSLDKEGLILANQGETLENYLTNVGKSVKKVSFLPDDDNIIPVLDDEWFEDDIVNRFYAFLKVSFGKEDFKKNLTFVEDCLGKDVRNYFVKDFYADHVKRYKKRPIYWQFSSPKGSFNVLIYMHRYTPDTLNEILNGYLKEYREKLKTHIESLESIMVSGSSAEQTKASKEKDKLKLVINELLEYERDVLYPMATERIAIDLDDGVLVNYNKFGTAIKKVAGLNDKKAKDKVRKFDWIDVKEIR